MTTASEWTAALRSGKYKQARSALYKSGGYCCLGVLCDVAGVPWKHTSHDDDGSYRDYRFEAKEDSPSVGAGFTSDTNIPYGAKSVLEDLDVTEYAFDAKLNMDRPLQAILMDMNDQGRGFDVIADYIDSYVANPPPLKNPRP